MKLHGRISTLVCGCKRRTKLCERTFNVDGGGGVIIDIPLVNKGLDLKFLGGGVATSQKQRASERLDVNLAWIDA